MDPVSEIELKFIDDGSKEFILMQVFILAVAVPVWSISPLFEWYKKIIVYVRLPITLILAIWSSYFGYDLIKISQKLWNFNLYANGILNDIIYVGNGWYLRANLEKQQYYGALENYIDGLDTSVEIKQKLKEHVDLISQIFRDEGGSSAMKCISELEEKLSETAFSKAWKTATSVTFQCVEWCQNNPLLVIGVAAGAVGIGYLFVTPLLTLIDLNRAAINGITQHVVILSEVSRTQSVLIETLFAELDRSSVVSNLSVDVLRSLVALQRITAIRNVPFLPGGSLSQTNYGEIITDVYSILAESTSRLRSFLNL